ncbi:MAG: hypothetical protein QXX08_08645 [Candidatus Bathyarchaeia archaeon]
MNSARLFFGLTRISLFLYKDDLMALVIPKIPELTAEMPKIEYVGYGHD